MLIEALFYVFGALLIAAALGVITARNPVYSALALVMCFIRSAPIWPPRGAEAAGHQSPGGGAACRPAAHRENGCGEAPMITLAQLLTLSGILFSLAIAGVFLNRKNVILLLMCVELLLLAANFNFIAFSRYLADINGQVFVFFILTVAAAESAIGLAILVVLFRERGSINVEDLNTLKG